MNIILKTNEELSTTVANGLAGVFVNGVSLSSSLSTSLQDYYLKTETSSAQEILSAIEDIRFLISAAISSTYDYTPEEISGDGNG